MAMVSHSNFGSSKDEESKMVHNVVSRMQEMYPGQCIDGEMQAHYALDKDDRDAQFPFNKLKDKDVNTLVFPNLSSSTTAYRMMLAMGVGEAIGPIQMGLNRPVHFISIDAPVRDIVNLVTVAAIDATVQERYGNRHDH